MVGNLCHGKRIWMVMIPLSPDQATIFFIVCRCRKIRNTETPNHHHQKQMPVPNTVCAAHGSKTFPGCHAWSSTFKNGLCAMGSAWKNSISVPRHMWNTFVCRMASAHVKPFLAWNELSPKKHLAKSKRDLGFPTWKLYPNTANSWAWRLSSSSSSCQAANASSSCGSAGAS